MEAVSHRDRALEVARQCGIARGRDFDAAGVTRATVKRLCDQGVLQQIGRGLYKLADAPIDSGTSLAEAARIQPRGVIRSEEHTSELQSLMRISYAVFCLKKKTSLSILLLWWII